MSDVFRCYIIKASDAAVSRAIALCFGPGGEGMWATGLSPSGAGTATHYISTGFAPEQFAALSPCGTWEQQEGKWTRTSYYPGNAAMVASLATQAGLNLTEAQVSAIFANSDVSEQEPFVAMARLGLKLINPPL